VRLPSQHLRCGRNEAAISLLFENVVKNYGERRVVDGVSLRVEPGTIVALAGANGSGKSTLFRIAAGFVTASRGTVSIENGGSAKTNLARLSPSDRVERGLSYVAQERGILRALGTSGNLLVANEALYPRTSKLSDVFDCLGTLRLNHLLDKRPIDMTGADALFLSLARAYLAKPAFLIADEPCTGILMSDHNAAALLDIAQTVHIMQNGSIVFSGTADATRRSLEAERLYFRKHA
jgi:ABC-type lipopolysaccharide export system ATPase subunit